MITNHVESDDDVLSFDKRKREPDSSLSMDQESEQLIIDDVIPARKDAALDIDIRQEKMFFQYKEDKPMAKLTWHGAGEREFEAGVRDVALYVINEGVYGKGVAWNGVTAINENPSGADATDLYADDVKYATLRSAEKFGFTLEAYTFPDEWYECDGSKEAETGVYLGQQPRKAFGLVYKTSIGDEAHPSLDKGYKLHIIYNSTASPSGRSYGTINENPDAITMSWEGNSTPEAFTKYDYKDVSTIVIDSTKFTTADQKATLKDIEDALYGSANNEPGFLLPDALLDMLQ